MMGKKFSKYLIVWVCFKTFINKKNIFKILSVENGKHLELSF